MFFNQIGAIMSSDAIPWWIKTMVGFATFFATKSVVTGAFSLLKTLFYTWPLKIITFFGAGGTFRIAMTAIFAWASRMGGHLVTFFGKGGTLRNAIMAFFTWIKTPFLAGSALRRAFTSLVGLVTRLFAGVIAAVTTKYRSFTIGYRSYCSRVWGLITIKLDNWLMRCLVQKKTDKELWIKDSNFVMPSDAKN